MTPGRSSEPLYDAAPVEVNGPEWELAEDNPVYGGTRRAAAVDARQRAEQYAEGLGLSVGGVRLRERTDSLT